MRRFAVVACVCGAIPAFGWGPEGHSLVARLAAARLTPEASAKVALILGPGTTLPSIASWADQVRRSRAETGPWHYIDIPIDRKHLDMARDCPKADCVVAKIEDFEKVLGSAATTPEQKKEALEFIVHFVGDMHQPLHSADNKDKGGNEVRLDFFGKPTNLHSAWDSGLLGRMGDEETMFKELDVDLTKKRAKKFAKGTVEDWAKQAHKAAVRVTYGELPKGGEGGLVKIDERYEQLADPVIKLQLEKAGARLAKVLNESLK